MAKEKDESKIHVDDDWKVQAQAEKEKLSKAAEPANKGARQEGKRGPLPQASFTFLVISLATQIRMFLGDIENPANGKKQADLELAKHNIDLLGMLEEKTQGNLAEEEKKLLDAVLYELRMRYVQTA